MKEYSPDDEKFYELIKLKKKDVSSMDIPVVQKNNLYGLINETVNRYEELKSYDLVGSVEDYMKIIALSVKQSQDITVNIFDLAFNIDIAKKNLELRAEQIQETTERIIKMRGILEDNIEILKEKDRDETYDNIVKGMRNQNP